MNAMPAGVYRIDASGTVRGHVSVVAGADAGAQSVGRNFFEDIAPCTNCEAFRGRVEALLANGGGVDTFAFKLRFPWSAAVVQARIFSFDPNGAWILLAHRDQPGAGALPYPVQMAS